MSSWEAPGDRKHLRRRGLTMASCRPQPRHRAVERRTRACSRSARCGKAHGSSLRSASTCRCHLANPTSFRSTIPSASTTPSPGALAHFPAARLLHTLQNPSRPLCSPALAAMMLQARPCRVQQAPTSCSAAAASAPRMNTAQLLRSAPCRQQPFASSSSGHLQPSRALVVRCLPVPGARRGLSGRDTPGEFAAPQCMAALAPLRSAACPAWAPAAGSACPGVRCSRARPRPSSEPGRRPPAVIIAGAPALIRALLARWPRILQQHPSGWLAAPRCLPRVDPIQSATLKPSSHA